MKITNKNQNLRLLTGNERISEHSLKRNYLFQTPQLISSLNFQGETTTEVSLGMILNYKFISENLQHPSA